MNSYKTKGVCASKIDFKILDGCLYDVSFIGGCDGNLKAICKLVEGKEVLEVIKLLKGIDCRGRGTSCADQLTKALEASLELSI